MWLWSLFPHFLYIDIVGFGPWFLRMHLLESFRVRLQFMSPDRCEAEKDFTEELAVSYRACIGLELHSVRAAAGPEAQSMWSTGKD